MCLVHVYLLLTWEEIMIFTILGRIGMSSGQTRIQVYLSEGYFLCCLVSIP